MSTNDDPIFYVYIYLDPTRPGNYKYGEFCFDYEPFYVGKGKGDRYMVHLQPKVLHKTYNDYSAIKASKIKRILGKNKTPIIIKLFENLYELESFETEKFLIQQIGMIINNTGPLSNLSVGGDGSCGRIVSENTRKLASEQTKKYWKTYNPEVNPRKKRLPNTLEVIQQIKINKQQRICNISGLESNERGLYKPIKSYDLTGRYIRTYESAIEVSKDYNITRKHICDLLKKMKVYNNAVIFLYANKKLTDEYLKNIINNYDLELKKKKPKIVYLYDLGYNFIQQFSSADLCAEFLNCKGAEVRMCCLGYRSRINKYITSYEYESKAVQHRQIKV